MSAAPGLIGPPHDCLRCPRLVEFRRTNADEYPEFYNGAVPAFGNADAWLLIVGLAPGLKGANRTGRPFTGDYAGELLYPSLIDSGLARGPYKADPADGLKLIGCRVTNAVRCVPPENKPTPAEQSTCRSFLIDEIAALPRLKAILALGRIAHDAVLSTLKVRKAEFPFTHGAVRPITDQIMLADSYHCSRYNVDTGVLTSAMFRKVLEDVKAIKDA